MAAKPTEETVASAGPAATWSDEAWKALHNRPATVARDASLVSLVEALAATDPQRALGLAQSESNRLIHEQLLQAALRGWAHTAPLAAGRWALAQVDPAARETAVKSVFAGAVAANPQEALHAGETLLAEGGGEAVGYGGHLVDALCDAGHFDLAAQLAQSGDQGQKTFWLGEAYSKWASLQPQAAIQAAEALGDAEARKLALHGVIGGLAQADPAGAVQFASTLAGDPDQGALVSQALRRWAKTDLKAASDWINTHEMGPAMDEGISSIATADYLQPDVALSWAESVDNPKLRSETLVNVLRRWATSDPGAVRQYFESSRQLLPEDREEIAGLLATLSGAKP